MIFFFLQKENMSWTNYKSKILEFLNLDEFPFHIYYEIDNSKLLEEVCLDDDVKSIVLRRPIEYMCDKLYVLPEYNLENLSLMKNYICMIEYSNYEKLVSRDEDNFWKTKYNKFLAYIIVQEDTFKIISEDLEALSKKFGRSSSTKTYLEENTKHYKNFNHKYFYNDDIIYSRQKESVDFLKSYKKKDIPYEFNIDLESIKQPPENWKLNEDTFEIDLDNVSDEEDEKVLEQIKENEPNFEPFQIKTEYKRGDSYTEDEYEKYLYNYLYELLNIIIPESKKQLIHYLLNKKTITNNWIPAFTHKSKDPNPGKNYETYEKLGDKILGYCFNTYLYDRNPYITESTINNLSQLYDSKPFQSRIAENLGLDNFLREGGIPTAMPQKEDVYESFCGCIDVILSEQSLGYGAIIVMNILKIIFKDFDFSNIKQTEEGIDINKNLINGKSWLEQLFSGLGYTINNYVPVVRPKNIERSEWKNEILKELNEVSFKNRNLTFGTKGEYNLSYGLIESQEFDEDKGLWTTQIFLTKEGVEVFEKLNAPGVDKIPKNRLIGKHVSKDKKDLKGFEKAKDFLEDKVGITIDFMTKNRKSSKFQNNKIKNLDQAEEKAKMDMPNFEKFDKKFDTWTGSKEKLTQLIGIDVTGYKQILFSKRFPKNDDSIQKIIDMYIES